MWPDKAQRKHARYILKQARRLPALLLGSSPLECCLCGYKGRFMSAGFLPRADAVCPGCGALERHRLLALVDQKIGLFDVDTLLHFAPEKIFRSRLGQRINGYQTTDLEAPGVDFHCNVESTGIATNHYDAVLAIHVLEHVNDMVALPELLRILKPGGKLIAMVPIIDGWAESYSDPGILTPADRMTHYGHPEHVRYYGSDFIDRVRTSGFQVTGYAADPRECIRFGLTRGEKVFVGIKPQSV